MNKRLTLSLSAVAVVTATALSACSSSSSSGSSPSASTSSAPGTSSTSAPGTAASGKLTGPPITVEVITELTSVNPAPEDVAGAQAAAAAVNASGGINGHPLVIKSCDAGGGASVTQAVTCARNLVSDQSVLSEVGDFEIAQDQVNTVLAASKVPNIGPQPNGQSVLSSPNSFPLAGSEGAALGIPLAVSGAKKIWIAYVNSPQAAAALPFTKAVLAISHPATTVLGGIPVDITTTDVTPDVTKGSSGDGVAMAMIPAQLSSWLTVAKQGSFPQKLSVSASALLPSELKALGANVDGVLVDSGLPIVTSSEPGVVQFRGEMAKYAPSQPVDAISLNAWLGTWAFAQVARTISGSVTRASVLSAFSNLTNFNVFGLLPAGFSTTKPFKFPGLTRLFNQEIVTGVVKNGQLVQTSPGYVPVFTKS